MDINSSETQPLLFISHKHVDSKIADVINSFIRMQSGGRVRVFQSSSPWADSPKFGRNLNKQLKEALWEASVVVLIYTAENQDWNYCMWECGVAMNPQSPNTKIILFECAGNSPTLFDEQVNVKARTLGDIQRFTNEFLTDPDFFPRFQGPVTRFQRNGQEVARAAADLYQELEPLLPPEQEDPSEEWPAWPFLQLELSLDSTAAICEAAPADRHQIAMELIPKEGVVSAGDKVAEQLFGVPSFTRGMKFERLIDRWRQKYPHSKSRWVETLCSQILDGIQWNFPILKWELMLSLNGNSWYAPVLNRVRKMPAQKSIQFDIYFYMFEIDPRTKSAQVGVPDLRVE